MRDEFNPFFELFNLELEDIPDICGPGHAVRGRRLAEVNAVQNPTLSSDGLRAQVREGNVRYHVEIAVEPDGEIWGLCGCNVGENCAHVAAVLHAWMQNPQAFMPRNVEEMLELLKEGSPLRELLMNLDPEMAQRLCELDALPESVRSELARLTMEELGRIPAVWLDLEPEATWEAPFRQLLESYKMQELRSIAKRRGFRLKGTAKVEVVEQLIQALRESVHQPDFLEGLTRQEHETLRLLNTVYGIRSYLTWSEAEYAWFQHHMKGGTEALRQALDGLFEYGLLFPCQVHDDDEGHFHWLPYLRSIRLPVLKPVAKTYPRRKRRELSRPLTTPLVTTSVWLLRAFAERETLHLAFPKSAHPQAHLYPWLGVWIHDIEEAQQLIQQGYGYRFTYSDATISIPTPGHLTTEEELERLARWLGADLEFTDWLVSMGMGLQLLKYTRDPAHTLRWDEERWQEWTSLTPEQQLRVLFNVWRRAMGSLTELRLAQQRYPELCIERSIRYPNFQPEDLARELKEARNFLVRLLQEVPADTWVDWNAFAAWAWQVDPEFLHSYWSSKVWGFSVRRGKRLDPQRRGHWERAYRPVLAAFLEGPLRWLGAVEVAFKGRNLATFRLTETGTWLVREEGRPAVALPEKPGEAPVTWLDERTFRLHPTPELGDLLRIVTRFTTPTNRPYTYCLSNTSIEQAFTQGITPSEIAKAFQKVGAPLPEATRNHLEDLWSRFGRVHLYENLTVLELADDLALREVLASTDLENHIVHQFSPRLVVIEDSAVDALVKELVKKGYTPKVSGAVDSGQWTVDSNQ